MFSFVVQVISWLRVQSYALFLFPPNIFMKKFTLKHVFNFCSQLRGTLLLANNLKNSRKSYFCSFGCSRSFFEIFLSESVVACKKFMIFFHEPICKKDTYKSHKKQQNSARPYKSSSRISGIEQNSASNHRGTYKNYRQNSDRHLTLEILEHENRNEEQHGNHYIQYK